MGLVKSKRDYLKAYRPKLRLKFSLKVFRYSHSLTGSFPASLHFSLYTLYILETVKSGLNYFLFGLSPLEYVIDTEEKV